MADQDDPRFPTVALAIVVGFIVAAAFVIGLGIGSSVLS
jgi:hypothetical protein